MSATFKFLRRSSTSSSSPRDSASVCGAQKRADCPNAATMASSVRAPEGSTVGCMSLYTNSGAVAPCSRRRRGRGEPPITVGSIGSGTKVARARGVTAAEGGCTGEGGCIPCEAMCLARESNSTKSARERVAADGLPDRIEYNPPPFYPALPTEHLHRHPWLYCTAVTPSGLTHYSSSCQMSSGGPPPSCQRFNAGPASRSCASSC